VSRAAQLRQLTTPKIYDILIIGGGATGAGAALDAAARGYQVACIERGDFASETSSRSTKLIWAGIKYMGTAVAAVLSPKCTIVIENADTLMEKQHHLCQWLPIAIPFDRWHVSPPPFHHALYGFFPVLAPFVLKFYDALSWFQCPPSYILTKSRIPEVFPQLDASKFKYCAVFYEAKHNDARTNLAIAMTAAQKEADIVNYVEMIETITEEGSDKVVGVVALDRMTGTRFEILANKIVVCGGARLPMI
jgi:glycerol-3-phosphate dehydrogenase